MTDTLAALGRVLARCEENSETGCWEWQGATTKGYGSISVSGRVEKTHRVTYEAMRAEIPGDLVLDHLCRMPLCCNPWHLEPVTQRVNVLRGESLFAVRARQTHCPQGHLYDEANTRVTPQGHRVCRTCHRERARASYQPRGKSGATRATRKGE
ncbi:HNH endonuclease [Streptomyces sp. NPDC056227]|uniref:HNH endonuclease signature motif containing protein n=1 Tax=Streptomyces sp. NPDC056227 TaxID=3345753 RepID=UPI0035DC66E4